jgi:predicted transporter
MNMRIYQYLFYTFYRWALAIKTDKVPIFKSLVSITFVGYLNIFSIFVIAEIKLKRNIVPVNMSKLNLAFFILFLLAINYIILVNNGKLKKIKERFKDESPRNRKTNQILVGCYVLLTFVLFFSLMYLKSKAF